MLTLLNNVVGNSFYTTQQTKILFEQLDFIAPLKDCIDDNHLGNKLQSIWIFDNISRDMGPCRDMLLRAGALETTVKVTSYSQ